MIARFLFKLVPPWIVGALAVRWALTYDPATLALFGVAAVVELILWFQRCARADAARAHQQGRQGALERALLEHPVLVIFGLIVAGVLIYVARAAYALGLFLWWAVGYPMALVHTQRYQKARAAHRAQVAQALIDNAGTPAHVAVGTSMRDRALAVVRRPLGLGDDVRQLPAPPRQLELPERTFDSLEHSPVAVEAPEIVQMAVLHGIVQTYADGSHHFDPLGGAQ